MTTRTLPRTMGPTAPAVPVEQLEPTLAGMVEAHESLLELAAEQREAMRRADAKRLGDTVERTRLELCRVTELEAKRQAIATAASRPGGKQPKAEDLAVLLPEASASRVRALAARLRELIARVREEHAAIRSASDSLAQHARGLIEQVAQRVSHAGTYSPVGRVEAGRTPVVTSMDIRS